MAARVPESCVRVVVNMEPVGRVSMSARLLNVPQWVPYEHGVRMNILHNTCYHLSFDLVNCMMI